MDITQFVMAYGVEQDRLSPPAADGGKRRRHPLPPGAGSLLRVLHPAGLNPPPAGGFFHLQPPPLRGIMYCIIGWIGSILREEHLLMRVIGLENINYALRNETQFVLRCEEVFHDKISAAAAAILAGRSSIKSVCAGSSP